MKTLQSKETFTFLGIVQDVPHIFVTSVVILVRRLSNFLTNDLIITGFVRVAQNSLYTLSLLKDIEDRCQIFSEAIKERIKKIEENNTFIFSSLETIMKNTEDRKINIRNELDKLKEAIVSCENEFLINSPQQMNQVKTRRLIQSWSIRTLKNL